MDEITLFTAGLGLQLPWEIESVALKTIEPDKQELHIEVGHKRGSRFLYEGDLYPVYDHQYRTWRHLRFFQHDCYLHARVPRIKTKDGKVRLVDVPWAESGSSFSLLFEQDIIQLVSGGMSASSAGVHHGLDSRVIFRIIARNVSIALASQELEDVEELSVDETSHKKGHKYLTIMCDLKKKKVVGIAPGKDKDAFANALIDMEVRGADRTEVKVVTMDMSRSYISACNEQLPEAEILFDRFHISKLLNEAVDQIRRKDQSQFREEFKNSRYLWLSNPNRLRKDQQERVSQLADAFPNIGKAYRLKELFRSIFDEAVRDARITPLNTWIKEAWDSGLGPIQDFVKTLRNHWYGIKSYFKRLLTNSFAERVNLKIQEIKRIAKGYRNIHHFTLMIYFHLGGLKFQTH